MIRVNSQSGKGGITFLLEQEYGISLPRRMQIEFSQVVQKETDRLGLEMSAKQIYALLEASICRQPRPIRSRGIVCRKRTAPARWMWKWLPMARSSIGAHRQGPLEALVAALPVKLEIMDYHEHAIGAGSNAKAAAYIEVRLDGERPLHGIGIDENITTASIRALFSAMNRALREAWQPPEADRSVLT